jgi:hypothetical protein
VNLPEKRHNKWTLRDQKSPFLPTLEGSTSKVATKQFTAITDPDHVQRPRAGNFRSMRKRSELPVYDDARLELRLDVHRITIASSLRRLVSGEHGFKQSRRSGGAYGASHRRQKQDRYQGTQYEEFRDLNAMLHPPH